MDRLQLFTTSVSAFVNPFFGAAASHLATYSFTSTRATVTLSPFTSNDELTDFAFYVSRFVAILSIVVGRDFPSSASWTTISPTSVIVNSRIHCVEDEATDSSWSSLATLRQLSISPTASISISRDTAYAGQSYTVTWGASGSPSPTVRVRSRTGTGSWTIYSTQASGSVSYTVPSSWILGIRTWEIRATNTAGSTTETDTIDIIADPTEVATDSAWSSLQRMTPDPSTDSAWSSLQRMTPEPSTDSSWSSLEQMTPDPGTDSEWSSLEQMTPPEPGTDSEWSALEQMTPEPGTDSEWSTLEQIDPPTTDGPWSTIITTLSLDGSWSTIIATPTTDGEWSEFIDVQTRDGLWSAILGGLETVDSPWSNFVTNPTIDSLWSVILGGLETEDGPWSPLIGSLIYDSLWSPFAFLEAITEDGPWSALLGSVTIDSEWSQIVGPLICDGLWSPFAFLEQATEDGPWSALIQVVTEDGPWSALLGALTQDSQWSGLTSAGESVDGPWSAILGGLETKDGPWSALTGALTKDGLWSPIFGALTQDSQWSAINTDLVTQDSQWSALLGALTMDSQWSALLGALTMDSSWSPLHESLTDSEWSSVSNIAYASRVGPLEQLWYILWSELSNTAYRPRAASLVLIVHRSAWSPVSNVARQEREVLSAIGGAEPFLHIYEARRGLVRVRRLVNYPTSNLFAGTGFEEAAVGPNDVDRPNDRALINPGITFADLETGDVTIDVYRTTNSAVDITAYRFYIANLEGVDPNIRRVYYDVTPSTLFVGTMPYRIRVTAISLTAGGSTHQFINFQRALEDGKLEGTPISFPFGGVTVPTSAELVVIAVTPQHDDPRLSRIVYRNQKVNNWYYYHGVPEIYVSDPLDIVANEDAFSYNGRDSANFQSPPHVGYASALVRQHQNTDQPWFEELLNRNHVITGQRVHMMLRDADGNYGKDFTGILQSPPLKHQDNIYDWRVSLQDPTTLMVQSFSNSATLLGPQDAMNTRTVGALIQRVAQSYADRVSGLTLDDVLDPNFAPANFPVPLAWFWTDYESERDILQRLVNTQGPPTGFYVNDLGQMVFTGCEDRGSPIIIGGANGIPVSQVVSFSDHVVDVANDARIPVSLHGWVLPDIATTPAQVYEEPNGLPEAVQVQLFETYSDNAIFDLARGGGIVFDSNGEYRYRVRTTAPVLPPTTGMPFRIVGVSSGVTVNQVAANLLEIVVTGTAGEAVPAFQVFGAELKYFRTIEHWTSPTVREENQTRFSRYLYHQREFSYGGYNSIALRDAQIMADWVVRYYRKGIKTMTLQLFCSGSAENVREGLRIQPDRTPVHVNHSYGDAAPEQWIVRSRKRIYRDGHFWIEVVLDEDVMYSLGLDHSPLCDNYLLPTASSATYSVSDSGELTYTGVDEAGLIIPNAGLLSIAPNLAATVLPFSASLTTGSIIKTSTTGAELFILTPGTWIAGGFNLRALQALDDSQFYVEGLRANGLTVWLVAPKVQGTDPYWGVMNLNLRADGITAPILLPAAFHFLRINYAAVGPQVDLVLSFVSPPMTIHNGANHWITVAQEQPWLGDSAGDALTYQSHVVILDWQVFPMDGLEQPGHLGVAEGTTYVTDAVIFRGNGPPSSNVFTPSGGQILRKFGRA